MILLLMILYNDIRIIINVNDIISKIMTNDIIIINVCNVTMYVWQLICM